MSTGAQNAGKTMADTMINSLLAAGLITEEQANAAKGTESGPAYSDPVYDPISRSWSVTNNETGVPNFFDTEGDADAFISENSSTTTGIGDGAYLDPVNPEDAEGLAEAEAALIRSNYISDNLEDAVKAVKEDLGYAVSNYDEDTIENMARFRLGNIYDDTPELAKQNWIESKLSSKISEIGPYYRGGLAVGDMTPEDLEAEARNILAQEFKNLYGFAKGGLVDFTGMAKLHGSRTRPEMVLNPEQTQMFIGLKEALGRLDMNGGSSESINIEKIEIKTDKLNGTQDFNAAGQMLASAFNKAIKNRGITTNVKR